MLTEEEIKGLVDALAKAKQEAADLKAQLAKVSKDKEQWFARKQEIYARISSTISRVRETRSERNAFTGEVKALKEQRNAINTRIGALVKDIRALQAQMRAQRAKSPVKGNPAQVRRTIERLEVRVETEPMSFEKEQALMKEIRRLKKLAGEFKDVEGLIAPIEEKSAQVSALKAEANALHRRIQETAKQSQVQHEAMLGTSTEIDELKKEEEAAYAKFLEFKEKYVALNADLKARQDEMVRVKKQLDDNKVEVREEEAKTRSAILSEKSATVQEKLKKGKKLTTEDILILQAKK